MMLCDGELEAFVNVLWGSVFDVDKRRGSEDTTSHRVWSIPCPAPQRRQPMSRSPPRIRRSRTQLLRGSA